MPLSGWLKTWMQEQPPEKSESVVICESLLMELDFQMREAEEVTWEEQKEDRRVSSGGIDYSWLVAAPKKHYEMPQMERLELEELCSKVKAEESGRAISMFRDALANDPPVHEIPRIFRAILCQILEGRPKEDTMGEWVMKSLTKLRPISARVVPISEGDGDGNVEMCHRSSQSSNSEDNTTISSFASVDTLPV